MTPRNHKRLQAVMAFASGALLPLAFSPFYMYPLTILAPALLLYLILTESPKRGFWLAYLFGFAFFTTGTSWIYISIHTFGDVPFWGAGLITLAFIAFLSLFIGLVGAITALDFKSSMTKLMIFPCLWVIFEYIRGIIMTGFPWNFLGYAHVDSILGAYIPILGVLGASFISVILASMLVFIVTRFKYQKTQALFGIFAFVVIILASIPLSTIKWTKEHDKAQTVALIQGNIPQSLKWSRNYLNESLDTYYNLTTKHLDKDFIVWPEAAIPMTLSNAKPYLDSLGSLAKANNTTILTGLIIEKEQTREFYNGFVMLGVGTGEYKKRNLVPFGEFTPLKDYLTNLLTMFQIPYSHLVKGDDIQTPLQSGNIKIASFICYEIAYAKSLFNSIQDANVIVTVANVAWFGKSLAPWQYLQIARARSLQTGRYQLLATNDGITAIIGPRGQVLQSTKQFVRTVVTGEFKAVFGSTPWMLLGPYPLLLLLALIICVLLGRLLYDKKRLQHMTSAA